MIGVRWASTPAVVRLVRRSAHQAPIPSQGPHLPRRTLTTDGRRVPSRSELRGIQLPPPSSFIHGIGYVPTLRTSATMSIAHSSREERFLAANEAAGIQAATSPRPYHRGFITMFSPYPTALSTLNPHEIHRQKSGRPASRSEILNRYHRDNRDNAIRRMTNLSPNAHAAPTDGPRPTRVSLQPFTRFRRTISRMLVSAAERIEPEAA